MTKHRVITFNTYRHDDDKDLKVTGLHSDNIVEHPGLENEDLIRALRSNGVLQFKEPWEDPWRFHKFVITRRTPLIKEDRIDGVEERYLYSPERKSLTDSIREGEIFDPKSHQNQSLYDPRDVLSGQYDDNDETNVLDLQNELGFVRERYKYDLSKPLLEQTFSPRHHDVTEHIGRYDSLVSTGHFIEVPEHNITLPPVSEVLEDYPGDSGSHASADEVVTPEFLLKHPETSVSFYYSMDGRRYTAHKSFIISEDHPFFHYSAERLEKIADHALLQGSKNLERLDLHGTSAAHVDEEDPLFGPLRIYDPSSPPRMHPLGPQRETLGTTTSPIEDNLIVPRSFQYSALQRGSRHTVRNRSNGFANTDILHSLNNIEIGYPRPAVAYLPPQIPGTGDITVTSISSEHKEFIDKLLSEINDISPLENYDATSKPTAEHSGDDSWEVSNSSPVYNPLPNRDQDFVTSGRFLQKNFSTFTGAFRWLRIPQGLRSTKVKNKSKWEIPKNLYYKGDKSDRGPTHLHTVLAPIAYLISKDVPSTEEIKVTPTAKSKDFSEINTEPKGFLEN